MQTEIVNLNDLVKKDHPYRKLLSIIDFASLAKNISNIKNNQVVGRAGYGVDACLKPRSVIKTSISALISWRIWLDKKDSCTVWVH